MLLLVIVLYALGTLYTQIVNNNLTMADNARDIELMGLYLAGMSVVIFICRFRIDYTLYKIFFMYTHKTRLFYTHNQIVGPLIIFLILYFLGISGLLMLLLFSRAGKDYESFRKDVGVLNHNYSQIEQMVYEFINVSSNENFEDDLGYIKYNINMFNIYEIALFEDYAKTIEYEEVVKSLNK